MINKERLRIALQKSGRLSGDSFELLARCGIKIRSPKDKLFVHAENFPLDLLLVRDDDIPGLVMDGICDLGIVGTNVLEEAALERARNGQPGEYRPVQELDFGACRLALAVPEDFDYAGAASLNGRRIATSYPNLLRRYLARQGIAARVVALSGSVEIAPRMGIAEAICDLVSTGATLEANQLRAVETVFKSRAQLIGGTAPLAEPKRHAAEILLRRMEGVRAANESKYIMLHAPKAALADIAALIPGAENPTLLPLAGDQEKVAFHAVCAEAVFWETMEKLKALGASSILVLPIEKMML
ncbi:MAG: ATP phosphoribosyltransferase [Gammaproteobacteria bacterium]|nr:ATP phosphoribosyltransferase [Gammaproteobacteria bacterium]